MPKESVKLDGREFSSVSQAITAAQDDYIVVYLNESGATMVLHEKATNDEQRKIKAQRLLQTILKSGLTNYILAGILTEKGKKWTRQEADANAIRFAEITDRKEQAFMRSAIVAFVIGFFRSGEASSTTSPKSSDRKNAAPDTSKEEVAISESSAESSEK